VEPADIDGIESTTATAPAARDECDMDAATDNATGAI
jgi:hypothetical protein